MQSVVVAFPLGRQPTDIEEGDSEGEGPWPLDRRIAWPRMSTQAVARALRQRPCRCRERFEFELGRKDRAEGRKPRAGASISYRRGYAWQGPELRRRRSSPVSEGVA